MKDFEASGGHCLVGVTVETLENGVVSSSFTDTAIASIATWSRLARRAVNGGVFPPAFPSGRSTDARARRGGLSGAGPAARLSAERTSRRPGWSRAAVGLPERFER